MSGLTEFEGLHAVMAPQYFGSVEYYAIYASMGHVTVDTDMKADKRFKTVHRCKIVDTRDEIYLTVPVSHPHGHHSWNDTQVSIHGHWWNVHLTALESAYGRTPFFEYYIDRIKPVFDGDRYEREFISAGALDRECDTIIRQILGIENEVCYGSEQAADEGNVLDLRKFDFSEIEPVRYYQIRADRLGFRAGLSILDLIFNMGPESPLVLRQIIDKARSCSAISRIVI